MLDELKVLLEMFAQLPDLALWGAIGFLIYKLAIIGSIFGVLKFTVEKLHDWAVKRKLETKEFRMVDLVHGIVIDKEDNLKELIAQIKRIRGKGLTYTTSEYIHTSSIEWLRFAIDAQEEREKLIQLSKEVSVAQKAGKEVDPEIESTIKRIKDKLFK